MNQAHYFVSAVEVIDNKKLLRMLPRALVSRQNVYRVFEESLEIRQAFLERKTFTVSIDGNLMKGRLVREAGSDGIHYNLRILHTTAHSESVHLSQISKQGFESPWKREYPRLSIDGLQPKVEVPIEVIFPRITGNTRGEVMNFSYHGLMFEIFCASLSLSEFVDQKLRIQMVTSRGKMLEAQAKIIRIYDEVFAPGKLIRGFGLKFLQMREEERQYYNGLILDACRELQKGQG